MERLVDRYLRDGTLDLMPLHSNQHAYQVGRFVEKALHDLVVQVEALDQKETALGVFLNTEGAFNYISFDSMCTDSSRHESATLLSCGLKLPWRAAWPQRLSMSHL